MLIIKCPLLKWQDRFSSLYKSIVYYAEGQNDDLEHTDMFMVLIIKEKAE